MREDSKSQQEENRPELESWLFIFSLNYTFWHLIVAFLNFEIKNKFMVAELFDFFTPFVMTFLIFKLYTMLNPMLKQGQKIFQIICRILMILGIIYFIEGHGMHLSANAITRHLVGQEGSPLFSLTYFFDEILGHLLWDCGFVMISISFLMMASTDRTERPTLSWSLIIVSSILYGFAYFCVAVEGQTVLVALPVSVLIPAVAWLLIRLRRIPGKHPVIVFFVFSYIFSLSLFIYWFIRNNGFPQFSELGWI